MANSVVSSTAASDKQTAVNTYQNHVIPELAVSGQGPNVATSFALFVEKVRSAVRPGD
jgi:hypothetical protein